MKIFKKIIFLLGHLMLALFEIVLATVIGLIYYVLFVSSIPNPAVTEIQTPERLKISESHFKIGANYLKKNRHGIWEMYIEGDAYERGVIYGVLSKELCNKQEKIFVGQMNSFVPNAFAQEGLKLLLRFFNKDLNEHIPLEYQKEIYGVSQSFDDEFDFIGPKYARILNYHAAHDIGHALNDYSVVGCSSFGIKGEKTTSGNLLVGRNFDFYVGDEFAEEKILLLVKPTNGYGFCSYSWAGFMGVASGMNEKGLSVTINASKSDLPNGAKTPVSLLAREILQYASTTDQAIEIAKKRELFVSETIMVGSKEENTVVLIEKSPSKTGVYRMKGDQIICTNHYQSDMFKEDDVNIENINQSDSRARYNRIDELLSEKPVIGKDDVLKILRDQKGIKNDTIGMGNPKAINQMLGHHSCIFDFANYTFYVSTKSWQLGSFLGYDIKASIANKELLETNYLQSDPFLKTSNFKKFQEFRLFQKRVDRYLQFDVELNLSSEEISRFINSNTEAYLTYELLAKYHLKKGQIEKAVKYYRLALSKELPSLKIKRELESSMNRLK